MPLNHDRILRICPRENINMYYTSYHNVHKSLDDGGNIHDIRGIRGYMGEKIDTVNGRQIFETEQMGRDNATTSIKLHAT